jgi:hypothetical protein
MLEVAKGLVLNACYCLAELASCPGCLSRVLDKGVSCYLIYAFTKVQQTVSQTTTAHLHSPLFWILYCGGVISISFSACREVAPEEHLQSVCWARYCVHGQCENNDQKERVVIEPLKCSHYQRSREKLLCASPWCVTRKGWNDELSQACLGML